MKFNSALFSSLLVLSISQIAMSADVWAAKQEKPERWFEVEVILFKQLTNKAALKEQFPDGINAGNLPNYRQSFDLFSPYLQPSLSRIKQFIPLCGKKDEQHLFLESLQTVSTPFPEQVQLIEQVAIFNMPDFTEEETQENIQTFSGENSTNENGSNELNNSEVEVGVEGNAKTETAEPEIIQELVENIDEISEEVAFEFDLQEETLAKPIFSTQNLCIITQNEMESLFNEEELTGFNLDSFGVDALPSRLNASGAHSSHNPYLIADESLLLKDINQRLRWSKEFRPLLHFGWRQVGITQTKAIPLKLFAGEHIEYQFQQALADYHMEIEEAKAIEKNLLEQLTQAQNSTQTVNLTTGQTISQENNSDETFLPADEYTDGINTDSTNTIDSKVSVDNKLKMKTEHKQQLLKQLFSHFEYINKSPIDKNTIDDIVNSIDEQNLENILASNDAEITTDDNPLGNHLLEISNPPKKPLQPWMLDGFLKIHLDHYLYITADFNVFNQNQVKTLIEDDKTNNIKLINFSQNRRVITGEIHYFDHPYIGMIIQIRRFDPTKPAGEQVSQAIK